MNIINTKTYVLTSTINYQLLYQLSTHVWEPLPHIPSSSKNSLSRRKNLTLCWSAFLLQTNTLVLWNSVPASKRNNNPIARSLVFKTFMHSYYNNDINEWEREKENCYVFTGPLVRGDLRGH